MPKKPGTQAAHTLGEFVWKTAQFRNDAIQKHNKLMPPSIYRENTAVYNIIANALPQARRMSYDNVLFDLVKKTENIETGEIIGQLYNVSFPFKTIWLAGPSPFRSGLQIGALINTDQDKRAFDIRYVIERLDNPMHLYNLNNERHMHYIRDEKILDTRPLVTRVSLEHGITLDEEKLPVHMQKVEAGYRKQGLRIDGTKLISETYSTADFFARLFVVLNCEAVSSNFLGPETEYERTIRELNRKRKQLNRPPLLPERPIVIDTTKMSPRLLNEAPFESLEEFLGKTHVRPSRFIRRPDGTLWLRKRDGQPWRRKEHDRRTKSPGNRENAPYVITASKAGQAEFNKSPDRPMQVQISPENSDNCQHA